MVKVLESFPWHKSREKNGGGFWGVNETGGLTLWVDGLVLTKTLASLYNPKYRTSPYMLYSLNWNFLVSC